MSQLGDSSGRIASAREPVGITQRQLAARAGLAENALLQIEQGARPARMDEMLVLASALGCTLSRLTGRPSVEDRLEGVARGADRPATEKVRRDLIRYLELDAYLEDQGILALL